MLGATNCGGVMKQTQHAPLLVAAAGGLRQALSFLSRMAHNQYTQVIALQL